MIVIDQNSNVRVEIFESLEAGATRMADGILENLVAFCRGQKADFRSILIPQEPVHEQALPKIHQEFLKMKEDDPQLQTVELMLHSLGASPDESHTFELITSGQEPSMPQALGGISLADYVSVI